jgi:hypothetical protein
MFNKVYVPVAYDAEVQEIQARVITPAGKVINLPADKVLDEEEDGRLYKKFALEGVEKGSEVEYIARIKRNASFFGLEVFQSPVPCAEARFTLTIPAYLVFTCKGYNGFEMAADTVIGEQRISYGSCSNIAVVENEKYAQTAQHLKKCAVQTVVQSEQRQRRSFVYLESVGQKTFSTATVSPKKKK